ncbi:MAG TPA: OmpA family protein [Kofleriaceae bacterium]|nr:OmpA family protein [Kofleriaceae bacterium]
MYFSLRHASLAACLAVFAACAGTAPLSRPLERPTADDPASASASASTTRSPKSERVEGGADGWRDYVPERCRDPEGHAGKSCRSRRIITTTTEIEILEPIAFVDNTAEPTPGSFRTIESVARVLLDNPSIQVIEVRGHSDSLLHPAERADLARKRAEVVAAQLVSRGVASARVTTYGASDSELHYPADDARNRRVEFLILAREE